jgi:broad specificity phosphatase PhoE
MALFYVVQHAEKERQSGDPGLTSLGRRQAAATAGWLAGVGLSGLLSSPLRRARETADAIAAETGLPVQEDFRLRERMNWDGSQPVAEFLAELEAAVRDRDFVPMGGLSSHQAAERFAALLAERATSPGPFAVVTHGGFTVDLLRTLLGDDALPDGMLRDGPPPCAITTLDGLDGLNGLNGLKVVGIASVSHLGP